MTPNRILKLKRPCHIEGKVEGSMREETQTGKEYVMEEKKEKGRREGGRAKEQRKLFSKEVRNYKEI